MSNPFDELNPSQKEAVNHIDGPLMVIAGAGSGKTRVLTYRIAHMITSGIDAFNILALTFTNKAATEMKNRISAMVPGTEAQNIWMGTFHSVFAKILRHESNKINYPTNFTIYDSNDAKNLIKSIVKELNLDKDIYKPNILYSRISQCKNNLITSEGYISNSTLVAEDSSRKLSELGMIFKIYQKRLFSSGAMDFDDLLLNTFILLRDFPEVLNKYQNKFKYILVDEYQDTNHVQYMIVKRLAAMYENICVVGDDAQSIYAFRGANIQNILNFKNDYPDFKSVKLEENYRSTQNIVNAANSLIKHNKNQIQKNVFSNKSEGNLIKIYKTFSDSDEGYLVSQSIYESHLNSHIAFSNFAILYRTNAQSRSIEEALRKRNIPYKIYGGLSFYQRKEVKDLLAYFRLVINSKDEEALKRVINYPSRGIGATTLQKLVIKANTLNTSIFDIITKVDENGRIKNQEKAEFNRGTSQKLKNFELLINSFKAQLDKDAYELAEHIAKSTGIMNELHKDKTPEGVSRYENIQELLNAIKNFVENNISINKDTSLNEFMNDVALLTDQDNEDKDDKNKVSLMTIHASKGLEFPHVYIVGLEENLFPSQLSVSSRSELEEERRLFYVALTRAEETVQLSFATSRWRWGQLIDCESSRFIDEIDEKHLEWKYQKRALNKPKSDSNYKINIPQNRFKKSSNRDDLNKFKKTNYISSNLKKISQTNRTPVLNDNQKINVGAKVKHDRFGFGKVLQIDTSTGGKKAVIFFENHGQKQLLLKFAKLTILEP